MRWRTVRKRLARCINVYFLNEKRVGKRVYWTKNQEENYINADKLYTVAYMKYKEAKDG